MSPGFIAPLLALVAVTAWAVPALTSAGAIGQRQPHVPCAPISANPPSLSGPWAGLTLRLIPAGSAILGNRTRTDPDAPVRLVSFTRPFWIGECEVTQAQWRAMMGNNPSVVRGDDLPVERVSHNDCQDFLRALAKRDGRHYRLPSADEWEYARRAGSSALPIAEEERRFAAAAATYVHSRMLMPAAICPMNAWHLRGMDGNAWEWVADADPQDPSSRLMCGGSCNMEPHWCRPEARLRYRPDFIHERRGLRIALDAD